MYLKATGVDIGREEDNDGRRRQHALIAFHDKLMGTADEVDLVGRVELKKVTVTSGRLKSENIRGHRSTCCTMSPPNR
jgi:hypothetical protein